MGLPEIEGRIICIVYKVRLHFIKERITCNGGNVITHHLIDREGYQKGALDRDILNKEVYYRGVIALLIIVQKAYRKAESTA